jgi:hypothetical protein
MLKKLILPLLGLSTLVGGLMVAGPASASSSVVLYACSYVNETGTFVTYACNHTYYNANPNVPSIQVIGNASERKVGGDGVQTFSRWDTTDGVPADDVRMYCRYANGTYTGNKWNYQNVYHISSVPSSICSGDAGYGLVIESTKHYGLNGPYRTDVILGWNAGRNQWSTMRWCTC